MYNMQQQKLKSLFLSPKVSEKGVQRYAKKWIHRFLLYLIWKKIHRFSKTYVSSFFSVVNHIFYKTLKKITIVILKSQINIYNLRQSSGLYVVVLVISQKIIIITFTNSKSNKSGISVTFLGLELNPHSPGSKFRFREEMKSKFQNVQEFFFVRANNLNS